MDMTENKDHIVEKKVYEDGKKEYASKGVGNAGLGKKSLNDIEPKELTKIAHKFAIDLLKDEDKAYNIREYFLK